jgi:hypothetical protein
MPRWLRLLTMEANTSSDVGWRERSTRKPSACQWVTAFQERGADGAVQARIWSAWCGPGVALALLTGSAKEAMYGHHLLDGVQTLVLGDPSWRG